MKTVWADTIDVNAVLPEYPRPQMERDSYLNLNGIWEYAITKADEEYAGADGEILVPFSPESPLSGVERMLKPTETLWYFRRFTLPVGFNRGRILLHFGAVDQEAIVCLNGKLLGTHRGGYLPFSFDITDVLVNGENELLVKVRDESDTSFHSRGKQKTKRGGIWYTPQSGIWQTVWCESVPKEYIMGLRITPLYDESSVEICAFPSNADSDAPCIVRVGDVVQHGTAGMPIRVSMEGFRPWSPEQPNLYDFEVRVGEDCVRSYFGMRKFGVGKDKNGISRLFLNGKPYFHTGVLDQGYWPDGLYTAPSDEAMICDIETMKAMGFNMLRKHIKVEPLRWYYHCDRLGMLVWQDMINGGGKYKTTTVSMPLITGKHLNDGEANYRRFGREDEKGRKEYYEELEDMVGLLYNTPSVAMWVPFNEGWGQFDAAEAVRRILAMDDSRTIDHASGWHDQGIGTVQSLHVYFRPYRFKADKFGRAVLLSEFGGYNCRIDGHSFNKKDYGYKKFETKEALLQAYRDLYEKEIIPAKEQGLAATVYTQLSDVEDELNGFLTYDRAVEKLPREAVRALNEKLTEGN
ncbi:MAG: glycoside hydrolase family 2 [Clostridiales bacterium]|nr:glycoside hydrolase family 2 [Clostridiales bacterium]